MWKRPLIAVLAVGVLGAASGCGENDTVLIGNRFMGHLELGCGRVACSDSDLAAALHGDDVYCYWDGDHVNVHLSLRNGFDRRIEFSIAPVYGIRHAGTRGDGVGTDGVTLDGGETQELTIDAGTPLGVPEGAPIDECVPELDRAVARG
jgi:hypothetical protein